MKATKLGNLEVEVVEFDEEKYKKNMEENDFSAKETYEGEAEDEIGKDDTGKNKAGEGK